MGPNSLGVRGNVLAQSPHLSPDPAVHYPGFRQGLLLVGMVAQLTYIHFYPFSHKNESQEPILFLGRWARGGAYHLYLLLGRYQYLLSADNMPSTMLDDYTCCFI